MTPDLFRRLVAEAALAPSVHNVQPARWRQDGDAALLFEDPAVRLPAGDAQGWGRFAGAGALALLSRLPVATEEAVNLSNLLWADLPGGLIEGAGLSPEARAVQRLSSTGHWQVPLRLPGGGRLTLLIWSATPPVFDGPEDRNGRRNHDEAALWLRHLDGALGLPAPEPPFVLLGNANLDPVDGEGRRDALDALLSHPRLQDPGPIGAFGALFPEAAHRGPAARDTVDWPDTPGPGNLRVVYLLPSTDLAVTDATAEERLAHALPVAHVHAIAGPVRAGHVADRGRTSGGREQKARHHHNASHGASYWPKL